VNKLKKEAVVTLLSLLEGNQNPKVPRQMLMTLNFHVMVLSRFHTFSLTPMQLLRALFLF
jgi:hypothetical protein